MEKILALSASVLLGVGALSSCQTRETEGNYLEVIGEYEQPAPEAGYRLNLSYNGPMTQRDKFVKWADSVQQHVPGMVKTNESIYVNYLPEEMSSRPKREAFQTSISYLLSAADTSLYNRLSQDLLKKNLSFNLNVMGTYMEPSQKAKLQQDMLQKALDNAKEKITFLSGEGKSYEVVGIEELDNTMPHGPEYYDFNRRMVARVKVKARLK